MKFGRETEIGFAGFYADCVHEVRSVTTGYRLTLVYNLRFLGKQRSLEGLPRSRGTGMTAVMRLNEGLDGS